MQNRRKMSHHIADLVVIQPTPFCNLDCKYCYLPNRDVTSKIDIKTVEKIAGVVFNTPEIEKNITILWHAGEPLTVPISFYEKAIKVINDVAVASGLDFKVTYNFQTNGTLIDDKWCKFFSSINAKVGVSIDGPEVIHNSNRVTRRGDGSFDLVMRGVRKLQEYNVDFSVLAVLTEHSIGHAADIFKFLQDNNIDKIGFNVEEIEGVHSTTSLDERLFRLQMSNFFETLWELSKTDKKIHIREFDNMVRFIRSENIIHRSDNEPLAIVSFDYLGNVSTFSPELLSNTHKAYGNFVFGNVNEMNDLTDILRNEKFLKVEEDINEGKRMCRESCDFFPICGGGSPSNKLYENDTFKSSDTNTCHLNTKIPGKIVLKGLEKEYSC